METIAERRKRDAQVRATINQKLLDTGEKDRLKLYLREKLVECGWRDDLKEYCKDMIRNKGLEKITVEELVQEITPRGRATVPDAIKGELLERIRKFLSDQEEAEQESMALNP
jgi:enhancer of yellow 2 transcription factor